MLDTTTMRRLAFIKYLYTVAIEQSKRPEPVAAVSLLTFHDAIELFLQLSSEQLDAGKTGNIEFIQYWDILAPKLKATGLAQKESMRRLNKARIALKHSGITPSKLDIEAFRASTTNFLEDNTPLVFGISFSTISLIELVGSDIVRNQLEQSERDFNEGRVENAILSVSTAFSILLDQYEDSKQGRYRRSPFAFAKSFSSFTSHDIREYFDTTDSAMKTIMQTLKISSYSYKWERRARRFYEFIEDTIKSIEALSDAVKIISLGIDYRRYSKFRLLAPRTFRTLNGEYHINLSPEIVQRVNYDHIRYCIDFVIETAVALQEFDYNVEELFRTS